MPLRPPKPKGMTRVEFRKLWKLTNSFCRAHLEDGHDCIDLSLKTMCKNCDAKVKLGELYKYRGEYPHDKE